MTTVFSCFLYFRVFPPDLTTRGQRQDSIGCLCEDWRRQLRLWLIPIISKNYVVYSGRTLARKPCTCMTGRRLLLCKVFPKFTQLARVWTGHRFFGWMKSQEFFLFIKHGASNLSQKYSLARKDIPYHAMIQGRDVTLYCTSVLYGAELLNYNWNIRKYSC